ncbi:hypothetical protein BGZ74_001678 [Mortierella antarctica]|nr:hypothetical protein BGZ74_001678 [Mortierella antarctica]KAG0350340.1 hypothetical protein BG005_010129 [Podila minutissima]
MLVSVLHGSPSPRPLFKMCWKVHDKYLCSNNKAHFEQFHVYYQKCNSCPHDRAHCGNLIMEREASKLFPWRCNVCAQTEFMDKTGRYKTEDFSRW